jgi:hypothetical protein
MTTNYILPPLVAQTDNHAPRYKVSVVEDDRYRDQDFQRSREKFVLGPADQEDVALYESLMGTPVFSTLEFPIADALKSYSAVGQLALQKAGVALRIDMAIITVTQTKRIIKTDIAGRDGSIKEFIGKGDYMIEITGAIVSPYPNLYPENEVKQLKRILDEPFVIPIAAGILNVLGIYSVAIEDYKIREMEGSRNMVPFTISCSSDGDDTVVIKNKDFVW